MPGKGKGKTGFANTKSACQSHWGRTLRPQFHALVRTLALQVYDFPQPLIPHHEPEHTPSNYPEPEDIPHTESSRIRPESTRLAASAADSGSRHGRHASSSSAPFAPPSVPHQPQLPSVQEEEAASTPMYLYNKFGQYMGKIEAKNGFRNIEIRDTMYISLPMTHPLAPSSWPAEMNNMLQYRRQPDDSFIDP
ncbi:hypothetical protein PG994_001383 [Apiospora phragmitis]|uniref:Uncharacterized protein n=1 Tax=Apiospora phragmitis TaxID=2905665 RepID=A0ABR1WTD8_9PEZI